MGTLNIYSTNIITSFIFTLVIFAVVMLIFYHLVKFLLPFATKPLLEKRISDLIPFKHIVNDSFLQLSNGSFASILEFDGIDYSNLSEGNITKLYYARYSLFRDLGLTGADLKLFVSKYPKANFLTLKSSPIKLLQEIFSKVAIKLNNSFELKYYIFCNAKTIEELEQLNTKVISLFNDYNIKHLQKEDLLKFLWFSINHFEYKELAYNPFNIHYLLSSSFHSFNGKEITIENSKLKLYASIFTLNSLPHEVNSKFINEVLGLNSKLEIIFNLQIFENLIAIAKLNETRKLGVVFSNATRDNQFYTLQTNVQNQEESLINTSVTFILYETSKEKLKSLEKDFWQIVFSNGYNLIQEKKGTELAYFNRFCGFDYILRPRWLTSSNTTHLIDYMATDKGLNGCDWGNKPIAYFKNYDGSIYKFFFHINNNKGETAVAHTVSFAPTGSGKTFLFQHLIAGTLYFYNNINVYCFDSNLGLKVFTESVGGSYLELKAKSVAFNPLLLDLKDEENKIFLSQWFQMISLCDDDESLKIIDLAIQVLDNLPASQRKLNICLSSIFPSETKIYESLEKFANGIHKDLFNGDNDSLNLEDNRLIAFDMTNILKDEKVCPAILTYIMFRIRKYAKKTTNPHLVFIDETSAMLQNPMFKKYIEVMLREHRKLRGSINIVFQNVSDISLDSDLKELIKSQCKTRFIFKNSDADENIYKSILGLNDLQMQSVKGYSNQVKNLKRPILLQKDNKVSILDVDLTEDLGELTKFYSSSINAVGFLTELKQNEPNWYEIYKTIDLEQLEAMKNQEEFKNLSLYQVYKQQQLIKEEFNNEN